MKISSSILVTGGTGSFGKKFIEMLLRKQPDIERVVVYSRDELKQFEMAQLYPPDKYPSLRFFIGDVRDADRLRLAMEGVDTVIHAAALKQVPTAEYNPFECIKTNVLGAQNVVEAAMATGVKRVVALSTDKAAAPINLYGASKLCSDKLFIAANNVRGHRDINFSVVRYGNVLGSRGSVIPFFLERRKSGVLPITDPAMTRFNITLEEGVDLVFFALEHALGGEIFVPKIPSYRITELAKAIGPECKHPVVGIRPGEKVHEEMVTSSDSLNTIETDRYYVIVPNLTDINFKDAVAKYLAHYRAKPVEPGFRYSSGANDKWLTVEEIRALIRKHLDPSFSVG
jgi:UDP-N-acetylglucosamine 4,6-dehydratase